MKISELIEELQAAKKLAGDDAQVYLDTEDGQAAYVLAYGVRVEGAAFGWDVVIGGVRTQ